MLHNIQLYGWITARFISLLRMGIWAVSSLFYDKPWSNEKFPLYVTDRYSDVPAGTNYRARSLGQRVIAFVIKIDTAKLACGGLCYFVLSQEVQWQFPPSGYNRWLSHFRVFASLMKWELLLQCTLKLHFSYDVWVCRSLFWFKNNLYFLFWESYVPRCPWSIFLWICQSFSYSFVEALYIKEKSPLFVENIFFPWLPFVFWICLLCFLPKNLKKNFFLEN